MFDIALGIFLFLSPIFFLLKQIGNVNALQFYQFGVLGNSGYNYLQLQFFQLGIISLFLVALLSKPIREFKDKTSIWLFLVFLIATYLHPISVKYFGNILLGFLLYYLVIVYTKNYKTLFKFILAVSILNTIFAILQFFNINLIYHSTGRCDGLMALSTHLGAYQAIVLPICYSLNPWLIIIPIISIVLSKSVLALFLMIGWLLFTFRKWIIERGSIFFMFLLSLLVFISIHYYPQIANKLYIRFTVWIPTLKMILDRLFQGYGIKEFRFISPLGLYENTCSIYFEYIYYFGVLSLIPLIIFLKDKITGNKIILSSCIIALIIGSILCITDYPRLMGTIIVLFGLSTITKGDKNGNRNGKVKI